MEYKVLDIIDYMNSWAKPIYQESWDNSGSQIVFNEKTSSVVIALDLTDEVIDKAIEKNSKLIITHHPMFFSGIKSIDENTYIGKNIIKAIKNNISIYSAHTSLDIADDGVNDTLMDLFNIKKTYGLSEADSGYYIGKVGLLEEELSLKELVDLLKDKLKYNDIRVYGREIKKVKEIAICGGSGMFLIDDVIKKDIKLFITGDIKHHDAQFAYENNITLIDISHYHGEKVIIKKIEDRLNNKFEIITIPINHNKFEVSIEK